MIMNTFKVLCVVVLTFIYVPLFVMEAIWAFFMALVVEDNLVDAVAFWYETMQDALLHFTNASKSDCEDKE